MKTENIKKQNLIFSVLCFIFSMVVLAVSSHAATLTASSCAESAVQSAINSAANGDTVAVPAGKCTWTSQATVNKTLVIQGAGIDLTTLVSHGFSVNTGVNDYRITGFTFDGNWGSSYIIDHGQSRTGNKRFRIDHNKFINKDYSTSGTIVFHGYSYGVIDHNLFQDALDEILSFGGDGAPAYTRTPIVGGYENGTIFVEDNTFTLTSACSAHFGGDPNSAAENVFDANSAPRVVFRYNTVSDFATCRWQYPIEMHGFESEFSTVGDARPIYSVEIYNNAFISNYAGSGMAIKMRGLGAGGVIFNNTFTGSGHSFDVLADLRNLRSHTSDDTGSLSKGNLNAAGYTMLAHARQVDEAGLICEHCASHTGLVFGQVNNLYIWNNTNAGPVSVENNGFTSMDIALNKNYFLGAMPGYIPYAYPHPLQGTATPPANTFYIRPGGTSSTCTDWTNACDTLPAALQRGATYYIADGAYSGARTFNTPEFGTAYIFLKKATASAHGTDIGWDPAYGDGVAAFTGTWTFSSGYWDIDGVTGGGPGTGAGQWPSSWTSGHGITQTVPSGGNSNVELGNTAGKRGLRFRHIQFSNQQAENSTGTSYGRIFHLEASGQTNFSDVVVEYAYVPEFMGVPFHVWGAHDWLIQYSYFGGDGLGNDVNVHRELWSGIGNDRWTFRWNYIKDINNSAIIGFVNEGGPSDAVEFYGNILDYRANGQSAAFLVDMDGVSNGLPVIANNWKFFNNTVVAWNGGAPAFNLNGGTGYFVNNLYANQVHDYGPGLSGTVSHNAFYNLTRPGVGSVTASWASIGSNSQTFSADPFVNYAARDLRLKAATQPGSSSASPAGNARDMFGNTRGADGVWDRGALEYAAGIGSPCDLNNDSATNVSDVQLCANQAIGAAACGSGDINKDGACNVVDVQRTVNAALGGTCATQ
jgi:hypothetical protein